MRKSPLQPQEVLIRTVPKADYVESFYFHVCCFNGWVSAWCDRERAHTELQQTIPHTPTLANGFVKSFANQTQMQFHCSLERRLDTHQVCEWTTNLVRISPYGLTDRKKEKKKEKKEEKKGGKKKERNWSVCYPLAT